MIDILKVIAAYILLIVFVIVSWILATLNFLGRRLHRLGYASLDSAVQLQEYPFAEYGSECLECGQSEIVIRNGKRKLYYCACNSFVCDELTE